MNDSDDDPSTSDSSSSDDDAHLDLKTLSAQGDLPQDFWQVGKVVNECLNEDILSQWLEVSLVSTQKYIETLRLFGAKVIVDSVDSFHVFFRRHVPVTAVLSYCLECSARRPFSKYLSSATAFPNIDEK